MDEVGSAVALLNLREVGVRAAVNPALHEQRPASGADLIAKLQVLFASGKFVLAVTQV